MVNRNLISTLISTALPASISQLMYGDLHMTIAVIGIVQLAFYLNVMFLLNCGYDDVEEWFIQKSHPLNSIYEIRHTLIDVMILFVTVYTSSVIFDYQSTMLLKAVYCIPVANAIIKIACLKMVQCVIPIEYK